MKSKSFQVKAGMQGVLVSCFRLRERQCAKEAIDLFEQFSETHEEVIDESKSIEDQLLEEVARLKSRKKKSFVEQSLGDIYCMVFIQTKEDPVAMIKDILEDCVKTRTKKTKCCKRFIPLQRIGPANVHSLREMLNDLLKEFVKLESSTYSVIFEKRFSEMLDRTVCIDIVGEIAGAKHSVDLRNSKYCVMIQVFKNMVGISLVEDYFRLRKFNLQSVYDSIVAG